MGNSNSLIDPSHEPTNQQLQYLRDLPPKHKTMIKNTVDDPTEKAKTAVLMHGGGMVPPKPTKEQITLAYQDCYYDIVKGKVDENYIDSIRHAVVSYLLKDGRIYEKSVQEAVEQLLYLASRMVKGENCLECGIDYTSSIRGSDELHEILAEGVGEIVRHAKEVGVEWSLGFKSEFALNKLSSIFPAYYQPVRYLLRNSRSRCPLYETMWCHENAHPYGDDEVNSGEHEMICTCRDDGYEGAHCKMCYWGERGEGYSHASQ